ncbi:MAG: ABC transporter permease, partial [Ruminococcus bromii]|nr:ABC transporter permease [Ruminococcus bromii]
MQSVLNKRILRDFKQNKFRYIALLLLISLSMYIVLSVVGAADTIISGTERLSKENNVEDGQFSTFLPLTDTQINKIADKGIDVQQMFSLDMKSDNGH